jgi:hypothetical protein
MHACIEPLQGSAAVTTALGIYCAIERSEMHAWFEPLQGSAAAIPHGVFLIHFMLL